MNRVVEQCGGDRLAEVHRIATQTQRPSGHAQQVRRVVRRVRRLERGLPRPRLGEQRRERRVRGDAVEQVVACHLARPPKTPGRPAAVVSPASPRRITSQSGFGPRGRVGGRPASTARQ